MAQCQLGLVVPFTRNCAAEFQRLLGSLKHVKSDVSFIVEPVLIEGHNLARARNTGIKSLLETCDVIACIDADLIIPPGLIDKCYKSVMNSHSNYWARMRDVDCWRSMFWPLEQKTWDEWKDAPLREGGRGSWNAMRPEEWIKSGGFDERCWGWGGEDDVLHETLAARGIPTFREDRFVLAHVRHEARPWPNRANENIAITKPTEWNWLKPNGHMTFFVTTICNRDCVQCSAARTKRAMPNYSMSRKEIDDFFQATAESNYRFESAVIVGGEPLMWPNLEYLVKQIKDSGRFSRIKMYTNGDYCGNLTDDAAECIDTIVVSQHDSPSRKERLVERFPDRAEVVDRTQFRVIIDHYLPGTLPANCCCGRCGYMYFNERVYICPMSSENFLAAGRNGNSVALHKGYLDKFMSVDRLNQPMCARCNSNSHVFKLVETVHA